MARCNNCQQCRGQQCVGEFKDIDICIDELQEDLVEALKELYKHDKYLLDSGIHEVCITSHIFHYFSNLFGEKYINYNIDPEYNRNGNKSKYYSEEHYARPDLIIHKRNCNKHNLLYIEFKVNLRGEATEDYKKIRRFISNESLGGSSSRVISYRYKFGASIVLNIREVKFSWFENGNDDIIKKCVINTQTWEPRAQKVK